MVRSPRPAAIPLGRAVPKKKPEAAPEPHSFKPDTSATRRQRAAAASSAYGKKVVPGWY